MKYFKPPKKHIAVIKIVGVDGPKTERTIVNVEESVNGFAEFCHMESLSDPLEICKFGAVQTPSVFVNGEVRAAGRIPSVHEVRTWIEEALGQTATA